MPDMPDAFQLDSGLREDMILSIHSAYFAPHADYQDGKQLMLWLIGLDENEEAVDVRMSVGADWTTDDGNVITHPTKRQQRINKNSIYGHFLSYAFEIPELAKELIDRADKLGGIGPRDARIWIDLIIQLQMKELTFGKTIAPVERLMPVSYLGLVDVSAPTSPAPPAPSAPPTASPSDLVAAARAKSTPANGSPLYQKALSLAKDVDFPTFLALAFADPDILADDELAEQCADQSLIWSQAH